MWGCGVRRESLLEVAIQSRPEGGEGTAWGWGRTPRRAGEEVGGVQEGPRFHSAGVRESSAQNRARAQPWPLSFGGAGNPHSSGKKAMVSIHLKGQAGLMPEGRKEGLHLDRAAPSPASLRGIRAGLAAAFPPRSETRRNPKP